MQTNYIKNLAIGNTFNRGLLLHSGGHVLDFSVSKQEEHIIDIDAEVQGSRYQKYSVSLSINTAAEELEDSFCECEAFYSYPGICKHCVAVLLEYQRRSLSAKQAGRSLLQTIPQRSTSHDMKSLLEHRNTRRMLPFTQKEPLGQVRLEPELTVTKDSASVEFKIGISHMYVLKDAAEFADHIKTGAVYSYGKKLTFLHMKENFAPQSQNYVDFICLWIKANTRYNDYRYYYYSPQKYRDLSLSSSDLERFLETSDGTSFTAHVEGSRTSLWQVSKESRQRKLHIHGREDGIELEQEKALGFRCPNYYIYFCSGLIYRIPVAELAPVEDFLQCMLTYNNKIFIAKADIPTFCKTLLPDLKKAYNCRFHDFDETTYTAAPVKLRLYLDADRRDFITFRGMAVYGEKEYNVYSKTDLEQRNLTEEVLLKKKIEEYTTAYDDSRMLMVLAEDDALLYKFLTDGIAELQEQFEVFVSDALRRIKIVSMPTVSVGVSLSGDLLELNLTSGEMEQSQLVELLSKYQRKRKFYRLKNGTLVHVENEDTLERLDELRSHLLLTDKQLEKEQITVPKYRALYVEEQLKDDASIEYHKEESFRNMIQNMSFSENLYLPPESLKNILREYQKEGFTWLKTLKQNGFGGILADDMGLGKTLQVIAFLLSEAQEAPQRKHPRSIIITPASLVYNWSYEFERFAPQLTVDVVTGTATERQALLTTSTADVLITSYDLLKRDTALYETLSFDTEVIDEAQYIKNHGTQAAKAVKQLCSGFRLALTGTPIENRLSELWSIFDYLMPGFLYSDKRFREEFEKKIIKEQNEAAMQRIQKMISPFVLRRLKKDVLKDLPDKTEENVYIPLQGEQQKLYDAHVQRMQMMLESKSEEEFNTSKIQILAELTKLRQLCCDPSILYDGFQGGSAKLDACIDLIQNAVANHHKVLLFSQFTSMLDVIEQKLKSAGIGYYSLTGATSKEKRQQLVNSFQTDNTSVFCISLKAGGTGLNLTAADIVIHFDPWWNVAAQNQATDRAHRIGQKHSVNVYKLIAKGTIEENIVRLQERKRDLADKVLEGSSLSSASMTREEMMEILRLR